MTLINSDNFQFNTKCGLLPKKIVEISPNSRRTAFGPLIYQDHYLLKEQKTQHVKNTCEYRVGNYS